MKDEKLLPCPFCGGDSKMQEDHWRDGNLRGQSPFCGSCGLSMPRYWPGRESDAITAWNTRIQSDAEKIAELEALHRNSVAVCMRSTSALEAENATLEARVKTLREALEAITELPGEINPSNYGHDDASALNASFCEGYSIAHQALAATEPKV